MVSEKFINSLRKSGVPYYQIARAVGISPNRLYAITSGMDWPHPGDKRVEKIAALLNIPIEECYQPDPKPTFNLD